MTIQHILDHSTRATNRLASQLRKTKFHGAILAALSRQVQEVEDALFSMLSAFAVDSAVGQQLDAVGAIVGAAREGRSDADYRLRVKAQVLINRRSGEVESLVAIFSLLFPAADQIVVREYPPASEVVRPVNAAVTSWLPYLNILRLAKAGGVEAFLEFLPYPQVEPGTFAFDGAAAPFTFESASDGAVAAGQTSINLINDPTAVWPNGSRAALTGTADLYDLATKAYVETVSYIALALQSLDEITTPGGVHENYPGGAWIILHPNNQGFAQARSTR